MSKKQLLYLGLLALSIFGLSTFFKSKKIQVISDHTASTPLKKEVETLKTAAAKPNILGAVSINPSTINSITAVLPEIDDGLCRYFKVSGLPLLPRTTFIHLVRNHVKFLILPKSHLNCLKNSEYSFKIVDYDYHLDFAYNYYADINLILLKKNEITNQLLNPQFEKIDYKKYGFKSLKELVTYLNHLGLQPNKDLVEFQVQINGDLKWPDSSSNFDFYPGLEKLLTPHQNLNFQDIKKVFISTDNLLNEKDSTFGNKFIFLDLQNGINFNSEPNNIIALLDRKLTPLIKGKTEVIIHQDGSYDPKANAIALFINAKYKEKRVSVLHNYLIGQNVITPKEVSGLKVLDGIDLSKSLNQFIFIDTRNRIQNGKYLRRAYHAPVSFSKEDKKNFSHYTETGTFSSPLIIAQAQLLQNKYPVDLIKKRGQNRKIVLYGQDDTDFSPLIFYEGIKNRKLDNIYWLRLGINRIEQMTKLNSLGGQVISNALELESSIIKNQSATYGDGNAAQVIFLKRKSNSGIRSLKKLINKVD